MPRARRTDAEIQGHREARRIAATLGGDARTTRRRRRITQRALAERVGLTQGRISELERGLGASAPLETWVALGLALERPLAVGFSRQIEAAETRDAAHLRAQELVLRLARRTGRRADIELQTRPTDTSRVIDVVIRDERCRALVVVEIWNRLDDIGAALRSTNRKIVEADGLAVLAAGDGPAYRVAACWLLTMTAANRRLVAAYPEAFGSRFTGSSIGLVRCLVDGTPPPTKPSVAWIDATTTRLVPLRRRLGARDVAVGPRGA